MKRLLLLLALAGASPLVQAERSGIAFYADQDLFLPFVNEDRDYTMGVGVEWFDESRGFYPFEKPLIAIARWLDLHRSDEPVRRSHLVGAINYTPDDLTATGPLRDDRPYASVLYFANKRVVADGDRAVGVEAQLGLLGTYVAREIQRRLHQLWRDTTGDAVPADPRGWGNQISAGGEPTARFRVTLSQRIAGRPGRWDLTRSASLSLGYQTNASAGLAVRAGLLGSPFWSLPYDPINRGNFVPAFGDRELYFWSVARVRAVAWDALLQGQFRDSVHTVPADALRRLVLDAGFGLTGAIGGVQLTVSANLKTAEADLGAADRTHWWGGLYLTVRY